MNHRSAEVSGGLPWVTPWLVTMLGQEPWVPSTDPVQYLPAHLLRVPGIVFL